MPPSCLVSQGRPQRPSRTRIQAAAAKRVRAGPREGRSTEAAGAEEERVAAPEGEMADPTPEEHSGHDPELAGNEEAQPAGPGLRTFAAGRGRGLDAAKRGSGRREAEGGRHDVLASRRQAQLDAWRLARNRGVRLTHLLAKRKAELKLRRAKSLSRLSAVDKEAALKAKRRAQLDDWRLNRANTGG